MVVYSLYILLTVVQTVQSSRSLSIKKDIKTKGFKSEHEKAFVNLIYTAAYFESRFTQFIKSHDITAPQYNALRILRGQHPNKMLGGALQNSLLHKMSNATRIVDRLIEKGFVEREKNPEDLRQMFISITHSGLKLLSELDQKVFDFDREAMNLPEPQLMILNKLLDDLRESASSSDR